jgi:sterol desaturase/sphingolipid hydroxylase (fatty acid hydroxylase superfamily)
MLLGLLIIVVGLGCLMVLERLFPDQPLVYVPGWWKRVLLINVYQLLVVVVGTYTWEAWLPDAHLFHLRNYVSPMMGGILAYVIHTWVFYWFHRARHNVYFLWLWFHQMHHSAQRIEAITSFYKAPQEILVDSIIMTILLYPLLGLSRESSVWLSAFAAFGEYVYHMNIKTPQWMGYFFQRPEAHRIHHLRNKRDHSKNYGDLPLWDILGGTFENPATMDRPTGFAPEVESRVSEMICGRDVLLSASHKTRHAYKQRYALASVGAILWIILGLGQSIGYVFNLPQLRGLSFATVASPLPLVFSVAPNGMETFSTTFRMQVFERLDSTCAESNECTSDHLTLDTILTPQLYGTLNDKPYNLRNAYGVLFSHGPFFQDEKAVALRDQVLKYSLCGNGPLARAFHLPNNTSRIVVHVHSNTITQRPHQTDWTMQVVCG